MRDLSWSLSQAAASATRKPWWTCSPPGRLRGRARAGGRGGQPVAIRCGGSREGTAWRARGKKGRDKARTRQAGRRCWPWQQEGAPSTHRTTGFQATRHSFTFSRRCQRYCSGRSYSCLSLCLSVLLIQTPSLAPARPSSRTSWRRAGRSTGGADASGRTAAPWASRRACRRPDKHRDSCDPGPRHTQVSGWFGCVDFCEGVARYPLRLCSDLRCWSATRTMARGGFREGYDWKAQPMVQVLATSSGY